MTVKIAPSPRQQFEDANGLPYSGAKLFTYVAGSSTKQTTYTTSVGDVANSNPIVLDSAGRTPYGVWLTAGVSYKFVLAPSTDTDPPTSPIFTEDNIAGVNDTTVSTSQWIASGLTPTYIGATQFSVVGDQTTELHVNRRLKLTVSAGTVYGKISVSAYTTVTTITVVLDSGALDSGLSSVEWAILSANNNSLPKGIFADLAVGNIFSGANIFSAAQTFNNLVTLEAGTDIASAATIDLTAATGNFPRITGTTPTSAVTMNTGQPMVVVADGAWPLTYHATTNKINTSGENYTCSAGDMIFYYKDLSGVVHGVIFKNAGIGPDLQKQTHTAFTTAGTSTAYTLTPSPAITANTTDTRFSIRLHVSPGSNPTLAVSGQAALSMKAYDTLSNKVPITTAHVHFPGVNEFVCDGTDWVLINPQSTAAVISNSDAAAGQVGEEITSLVGATNAAATGAYKDLTSITLTPGDWDVYVQCALLGLGGGVTCVFGRAGIGTASGNNAAGLLDGDTQGEVLYDGGINGVIVITPKRYSLSASTTLYLKIYASYTVGTPQFSGRITARRRR